jgi:hypothetical protein
MLDEVKAGGGPSASQWNIRFDPDNAAGSCSRIEIENLDGTITRILLDAGWAIRWLAAADETDPATPITWATGTSCASDAVHLEGPHCNHLKR